MLFHIEQAHAPQDCPYGKGGSASLRDDTVSGVKVLGSYGNFMQHVVYLIVEADDINSLNQYLLPGLKTCTTKITPVSAESIPMP
ncbi:MAG TPA: DUF3303 family protein [Chloroflexota bacterium]